MKKEIKPIVYTIFLLIMIIPLSSAAILLSDQGTAVTLNSTGQLLQLGNLTITISDNATEGNLIFNQTFNNAIANGSWNLMISPNLEFGNTYWKDYTINGEDLDFDGNERLNFQSPLGVINNISLLNLSHISCSAGSSVRKVYANGSVDCEIDDTSAVDLSNYALKNQSETFSANVNVTGNATASSGFFTFLGSLTQRITRLFIRDINASGNIDVGGNITATKFIGDGSLLTNIQGSSFNSTYASFAYNQTVSPYFYNQTANQYYYNMSDGNSGSANIFNQNLNSTTNVTFEFANLTRDAQIGGVYAKQWLYNQTVSPYFYNQTANQYFYNQTANQYYYNQTASAFFYNMSDGNSGSANIFNQNLNSTTNVTFEFANLTRDAQIGGVYAKQWLYNQTVNPYFYNQTANQYYYNQTASAFFYNMSDGNSGSANIFNQNLNSTTNVTFEFANLTRDAQIGGVYAKQWLYNQTASTYFYNQTANQYYYNQTASAFFYNQTASAFFYNMSDGNSGSANIFNQNL